MPMPNIRNSIFISLMIHAVVIGGIVGFSRLEFPRNNHTETLVIEIDGTISDKQSEEKTLSARQQKQEPRKQSVTPPTPPKPKPRESQKETKKSPPVTSDEGIVQQQDRETPKEEKKVSEAVPKENTTKPSEAKASSTEQEMESKQQTIDHDKMDIDALKRYLSALKRKLQGNIIYPKEAKTAGYKGNPTVQFRVNDDGSVDTSSITIKKSSGYTMLDANAIDAVIRSAPFEKPARAINIAVEVVFSAK